jgi:uncharacterized protein (DUF952 family)
MSPNADLPQRIYHLALRDEWDEATMRGAPYERSTLGRSLESEGFIHCSFASQVQGIANTVFRNRDDVILLTIDTARVDADIRVEAVGDVSESYPHVYGPLALDTVIRTAEVPRGEDGRLLVEALLDSD